MSFSHANRTGRSYSNLDDVIEALERKDVTGILIDTFAGGSRTELLDKPNLRVYQVLGVSSTYGAVLAGESTKLARCFRAYNLAYAANITRHVERNTQQLRVRSRDVQVTLLDMSCEVTSVGWYSLPCYVTRSNSM